jgi:hypothetical protein
VDHHVVETPWLLMKGRWIEQGPQRKEEAKGLGATVAGFAACAGVALEAPARVVDVARMLARRACRPGAGTTQIEARYVVAGPPAHRLAEARRVASGADNRLEYWICMGFALSGVVLLIWTMWTPRRRKSEA